MNKIRKKIVHNLTAVFFKQSTIYSKAGYFNSSQKWVPIYVCDGYVHTTFHPKVHLSATTNIYQAKTDINLFIHIQILCLYVLIFVIIEFCVFYHEQYMYA